MRKYLSLVLCGMALLPLQAIEKPSAYHREQIVYEVDVKRASDLEQSWSGLRRYISRDHYVAVHFTDGSSKYRNYKLVELQRHGALVNIKLENIEDDDDWTVLSIRASTILQLQVLEEKW